MPFDTPSQDFVITECDTSHRDTRRGGVGEKFKLQVLISLVMVLMIAIIPSVHCIEEIYVEPLQDQSRGKSQLLELLVVN